MSSGNRIGMPTMAGVQLGLVFHTLLAIFGITVIIASSETLFKGVAIAGAIYLTHRATRLIVVRIEPRIFPNEDGRGNIGEMTDGWSINHWANEGIDTSRRLLEGVRPNAEGIRRTFIR